MNNLLDDCHEILTELGYIHRYNEIQKWHILGQRLDAEEDLTEEDVKNLSDSLNVNEEDIWCSVLLYRRYPNLEDSDLTKDISWYRLKQEL